MKSNELSRFPTTLQFKGNDDPFNELAYLEGTWMGNKGWNIISVPNYNNTPEGDDFKLLVDPYTEILSFEKIAGGVPNRGTTDKQVNYALKYDMQVNQLNTKSTIHAENGMFIYQSNLTDSKHKITRQSIVPHGNSILAFGNAEKQSANHLSFEGSSKQLNKLFSPLPKDEKGIQIHGSYVKPFEAQSKKDFDILQPINFLLDQIKDQNITEMITLDLACDNNEKDKSGGILNTPFITKNANTPSIRSIFWVEKVKITNENYFMQLQYAQVVDIVFPTKKGTVVTWPHVSINTLVRIK